jgi:hypothetical protein
MIPWASRIRSVRWLAAARKTSGAEEWEYSSRKWCSTSHRGVGVLLEKVVLHFPGVVEPEPVRELTLSERVLQELVLGIVRPRPGQLVLVEDSELHRLCRLPNRRLR